MDGPTPPDIQSAAVFFDAVIYPIAACRRWDFSC